MATLLPAFTWRNGFRELSNDTPWKKDGANSLDETEEPHFVTPPASEILTSTVHNDLGLNTLRTWPTIYDGTSSPHGVPDWWKPSSEVDVLICGGERPSPSCSECIYIYFEQLDQPVFR